MARCKRQPGKSGLHCARKLRFKPRASVKSDPSLIGKELDGAILGLVVHLFAVLYPVAQVNRVQLHARGFGDLPEDCVGSQAAALLRGLVESVKRQTAHWAADR